MRETLDAVVNRLKLVKTEAQWLTVEDLDLLKIHLKLLQTYIMRVREKRRRENRG